MGLKVWGGGGAQTFNVCCGGVFVLVLVWYGGFCVCLFCGFFVCVFFGVFFWRVLGLLLFLGFLVGFFPKSL